MKLTEHTVAIKPSMFPVFRADGGAIYWLQPRIQSKELDVIVTDARDGHELSRHTLSDFPSVIQTSAFLDANRLVIGSDSMDFRVINLAEGRWESTVLGSSNQRVFTVTPDSRRIVSIGAPYLTFWNIATGEKLNEIPGAPSFWPPRGITIRADGKRIAAVGVRGQIRLWWTKSRSLETVGK